MLEDEQAGTTNSDETPEEQLSEVDAVLESEQDIAELENTDDEIESEAAAETQDTVEEQVSEDELTETATDKTALEAEEPEAFDASDEGSVDESQAMQEESHVTSAPEIMMMLAT